MADFFIGLVSNTWSVDQGFTTARSDIDVSIYPSVGLILGANTSLHQCLASTRKSEKAITA